MFYKISGAICALFTFVFLIVSTLSPISHTVFESTAVFNESKSFAHTQFGDSSQHIPVNYENVKAMWFPFFEYADTLQGKSKKEFTQNIYQRFSNAKDLGINTVYVHARAHGDAYYFSDIFPTALRCSGTLGKAIDFDPLEVMTQIAHSLGLSVHAWVNPLRLMSAQELPLLSDEFIIKQWYNDKNTNGNYIVCVDDIWYLNPAYNETRELVVAGIKEILSYDIDGIHIDDYFYPTVDLTFDSNAFALSGADDITSWRFENTNSLVKQIYECIKSHNEKILFGISPAARDNTNDAVYADVDLWCTQSGFCDYIVPQIYFGYENESAPFLQMLDLWKQKCTDSNVQLIIGICTYKYSNNDDEWSQPDLSARQLEDILSDETLDGAAVYSYSATFEPAENSDLYSNVRNNIKSILTKDAL